MELRIICGQMEVIAGRPDLNYQKICELIEKAKKDGADILLLPEMCVSGYFIGDLWEQETFLEDCLYYNQKIIAASSDIAIIFGSVAVDETKRNADGSVRKYNAAYVCQNGRALEGYAGKNYIIKTLLPNYHEFEDSRHFTGLPHLCSEKKLAAEKILHPVELTFADATLKIGILICEDSWSENSFLNPAAALVKKGAELLVNISCSPFASGKISKRREVFGSCTHKLKVPLIYCNNVGVQNNGKNIFVFDGNSSVFLPEESEFFSSALFEEDFVEIIYNLHTKSLYSPRQKNNLFADKTEELFKALTCGAAAFLRQCGIKKMTVGLSGGIDSAVAAALYTLILGKENVLLLNLPSRYNSEKTKKLAQQLAINLETNYAVIPIEESFTHTVNQLTSVPISTANGYTAFLTLSELDKENIQARDRGARVIAAAAAAFGGAFSCNSNKTEITVGYATFYGDISGALSIIGDLWKEQVYSIGRYLNEKVYKKEIIPQEIFTIRPSAELSAHQSVGKGGDPMVYAYNDCLFRAFVERTPKASPADILSWYMEGNLAEKIGCPPQIFSQIFANPSKLITDLEKWWKLFAGFAVAKRIQAPPILSVSPRAFGGNNKEALLTPYFSRKYYELKELLLKKC